MSLLFVCCTLFVMFCDCSLVACLRGLALYSVVFIRVGNWFVCVGVGCFCGCLVLVFVSCLLFWYLVVGLVVLLACCVVPVGWWLRLVVGLVGLCYYYLVAVGLFGVCLRLAVWCWFYCDVV